MTARRTTIFLLFALAWVSMARAQGETKIWTDKEIYTHGETIEVTLEVTNTDPETHVWTTYCNSPTIQFDGIFLGYEACITFTQHFWFSPGSWRSWTIPLRPQALGLPLSDGEHEIIVRFAHLADTIRVEAPRFAGGRLDARIPATAHPDSLAAIRSQLQAVTVSSVEFQGTRYEIWEIEGVTTEAAVQEFSGPHVFLAEHGRWLSQVTSVNTDDAPILPSETSITVYPNPSRGPITMRIRPRSTGIVRTQLFDVSGRLVRNVFHGLLPGGAEHLLEMQREGLPAGAYIWRVTMPDGADTGVITFLN